MDPEWRGLSPFKQKLQSGSFTFHRTLLTMLHATVAFHLSPCLDHQTVLPLESHQEWQHSEFMYLLCTKEGGIITSRMSVSLPLETNLTSIVFLTPDKILIYQLKKKRSWFYQQLRPTPPIQAVAAKAKVWDTALTSCTLAGFSTYAMGNTWLLSFSSHLVLTSSQIIQASRPLSSTDCTGD